MVDSLRSGVIRHPLQATVRAVAQCDLPTRWATFRLHGFSEVGSGREHVALTLGDIGADSPLLARLHSECLTGDGLFSQRCDCGAQLERAMERIAQAGRGVIVYLRQEGRGIGLLNKIRAYALQDQGLDTVEANQALGFPADARRYEVAAGILHSLGVAEVQLMSNNPDKGRTLDQCGIRVHREEPHLAGHNEHNRAYLATKARRMGHRLPACGVEHLNA